MRRAGVIAVLGLGLALPALAGCSGPSKSAAPPTPAVGVVADSGFRPGPNGFTFVNYGDQLPDGFTTPTNLTPADVKAIFGSGVCADAAIGKCDLIPQAQAWMDQMNQEMADGHCFGFSVVADLVWANKINTSAYGAPTINNLAIDNNTSVQSTIAQAWTYQTLASVQAKKITGDPNKILTKLIQVLKPHPSETYTVTIWKSDGTGGHAVTPYEVDYKGNGQYQVLIYDNNWPDDATRAISFDTTNDTWSYDAASNPSDPSELYQGDAKTQTISLFPTSPGRGLQPCPFCGKVTSKGSTAGTTGGARTAEISLIGSATNHSHVLVTDQSGHRLGRVNGQLVNQIPGAHYLLLTSDQVWKNKLEPVLYMPANVAYTITLDGSALTAPDTESIQIIGPAWHIAITNIAMQPGDEDTLTVDPNATRMTYHTTRAQSPTFEASVSDTRAHYAFGVSGVSSQPGTTFNFSVPPEGGSLIINNAGSAGTSSVNLQMTRYTEQGLQHFSHAAIPLTGGDTADLQFGDWTNTSQGIPLVTTHNGQQSTQTLTNQ
jgi:hypothetical protein